MLNNRQFTKSYLVWGAALLCLASLSACKWGHNKTEAPAIKTHKPALSAEGKGDLGFYTGAFEATPEQVAAKTDFEAFVAKKEEEEQYDVSFSDLNEIPAKFRPYVYKNPLYGTFGLSKPNHLSLVIDPFNEDQTVSGRSVAAGNDRPLTGTWEKTQEGYHLQLKEPGDNPNDGQFDLQLNSAQKTIQGSWAPNNPKVSKKSFTLKQAQFHFDPEAGQDELFIQQEPFETNPSTTALKSKEVENLTQPEIKIIRNMIYARHGYTFGAQDLRQFFENSDWYVPYKANINKDLSAIEKNNIALLKRYENYAKNTYESFGR